MPGQRVLCDWIWLAGRWVWKVGVPGREVWQRDDFAACAPGALRGIIR